MLRSKAELLCKRLQDLAGSGQVVHFDSAFSALTTDVITKCCFDDCANDLHEPDFRASWRDLILSIAGNGVVLRQFPWLLSFVDNMPLAILRLLMPGNADVLKWQGIVRKKVDVIIANNENGKRAEGTIFQAVLDSDLPPQEKTAERLQNEAQTLLGAGTETTAKVLTIIAFYLYNDKKLLKRLREELTTIMPEPTSKPSLSELERLPLLV